MELPSNLDPNLYFRYNSKILVYRIYAMILHIDDEKENITSLLFTICYYNSDYLGVFFSDLIPIPCKSNGNKWLKLDDMSKIDSMTRFTVALPASYLPDDNINLLHDSILGTEYVNYNPVVYSSMIEFDLKNQRYESIISEINKYLSPVASYLNKFIIKSEEEQKQYESEANEFMNSMSEFFEKSKIIISKKGDVK